MCLLLKLFDFVYREVLVVNAQHWVGACPCTVANYHFLSETCSVFPPISTTYNFKEYFMAYIVQNILLRGERAKQFQQCWKTGFNF